MKKFILMSAPAGCGKTTYCLKYQREHENVHIISSDDVKMSLFAKHPEYQNLEQNKFYKETVWPEVDRIIESYSKEDDVTVILDATNVYNWKRNLYYDKYAPFYEVMELVYFSLPKAEILRRNAQREGWRRVPDEAMNKLMNSYEPLSEDVIAKYDSIIEVNLDGEKKIK